MKLFRCSNCSELVYFDNTHCLSCNSTLAYDPVDDTMVVHGESALPPGSASATGTSAYFCANHRHGVCNWLAAPNAADGFCLACQHNRLIPDLSQPNVPDKWAMIERAKHRLIYSLLRFGLPLATRREHPEGLLFQFVADDPAAAPVLTGHDAGTITVAIEEADPVERERRRTMFGEPYRTLLGHFRHEIAHYYWDRLIRDAGMSEDCAAVFGDHTADYAAALKNYYKNGPPPDWQQHYVSAYATAHPWEDFAETFAHYLHIVDTLEMASAFNVSVAPKLAKDSSFEARIAFNPYKMNAISPVIQSWLPLTYALNNLNRCMGQQDLYPFTLTPTTIDKLGFIQRLIFEAGETGMTADPAREG